MVGKEVKIQLLHGSNIGALAKELTLFKYMSEENMKKMVGAELIDNYVVGQSRGGWYYTCVVYEAWRRVDTKMVAVKSINKNKWPSSYGAVSYTHLTLPTKA